ncbi:amidase [Pusillimonas sp. TS35]|nr:amidase [Pusillimonas sp. TS35]
MTTYLELNELGALETALAIKNGETTATAVAQSRLDLIEACNDEVKAFVAIDPSKVLAEAARVDAGSCPDGLLAGVPFAVKDVIDTSDYPTAYGSPIYTGHQPRLDAACVRLARRQGAVVMGKVATGEFATQTPSLARNPLRTTHTPGGSSSGSAAAVAAGMVPVAFGTQTTGSIVRPAVYCGVVGYKPSFGMIGAAGMKTLSHTQDTIGVIARDVADVAFFTLGLHGTRPIMQGVSRPRIALCRSRQWDYISSDTYNAIEKLATRIEMAGGRVEQLRLPEELELLAESQPRLFMFEARQNLAYEYETCREHLSPRLRSRLEAADTVCMEEYMSLRQQIERGRQQFAHLTRGVDAILYPAAAGEAEAGHNEAGDPRFGALWTMLHVPTVSFPCGTGPTGLPLGVQLVGGFGEDAYLLAVANTVSGLV